MARPSYIYQGGSVMMHSPLQLKQSEMLGYFVRGDLAKLQATVNTTLYRVAGRQLSLKALSPYVMLTFTRVNHADSANPVDQAKGWITEVDIVTWIMVDNSSIAPEKIAILGGGVGSLTAAWYLTDQPDWQDRYEITVYQLGWRLGGKGASGRNAQQGQRIEEHGLHIWFGFYANAFSMIKQAYAALDRPPGSPLATWRDAFRQHDYVALSEDVNGAWRNWSIVFPTLPGEPGEGGEDISLWQMAVAMVGWIEQWIRQIRQVAEADARIARAATDLGASAEGKWPGWLHRLADEVVGQADELGLDVGLSVGALVALVADLAPDSRRHEAARHQLLASTLQGIRAWLRLRYRALIDADDELRRLFTCLDLGITVMKGCFEDGVFKHGFDVINDMDFRDWLRKHGGDERYSVNSAPVRGFYDLVFAYEGVDFSRPNIEAGTLLRSMARIGMAYLGGIMFKMQAGMGDTVFTPLYEVLQRRGVQFKFFQRVEELVPGAGTGEIDSIRIRARPARFRGNGWSTRKRARGRPVSTASTGAPTSIRPSAT